jgi:alpha-galactosidase
MQSKSGRPVKVRLETLDLVHVRQGWAEARANRSCDGNPLRIGGVEYRRGIGTHAHSEMLIRLNGKARRFTALCGIDDEVKQGGSVVFEAWVDGKPVARTAVLRCGDKAERLEADLSGAEELFLLVHDADDGAFLDHADWADPVVEMEPGETRRPESYPLPGMEEVDIAPFPRNELRINGPRVVGCTPGRDFQFRIPVTGPRNMSFMAENLPDGLAIDTRRGLIWGSVRNAGEYTIRITVSAGDDTATGELRVVAGKDKLALTPPMGWNSWNCWGTAVDEEKVRTAADWMDRSGLACVGYQYVNIDDCWQGERDKMGNIQTNERFGDMRALADYVHRLGLRIGTYSSPGPKTCAGYTGSFKHEFQDARRYAEWKMDFLKYDMCSYIHLMKEQTEAEQIKPYRIMGEALSTVDRDIVYSLCQYGCGAVYAWGPRVRGNLWRTTEDITDTWGSVIGIAMRQPVLAEYAGPGRWNDPDMLVVGRVGWAANLRQTKLTKVEQVTHITLWAMLAAPLLIGCDMAQMDDFTLAVLGNPEVIDVDQDPLGRQGTIIRSADMKDTWMRPLEDGSVAVALVNRGPIHQTVSFSLKDTGLDAKKFRVRDLWKRKDIKKSSGKIEAELPPHGAMMLRIWKA